MRGHRTPAAVVAAALALACAAAPAAAKPDKSHKADSATKLEARAVLPALTFAPGPSSGNLIGPTPINGVATPFPSQPVQGFSAALPAGNGRYWVMADNGYGSIENSADFNLRVYLLNPDLETADGGSGTIKVERYIEVHDPDHKVPFALVNEWSAKRALTGADFDIESLQRGRDGTLWFGDEFGPFLLHTDSDGKVLDPPYKLPDADNPGKEIRAPQNPFSEESSTLRTMNALRGDVRAHGGTFTPVVSPDANLLADGDPSTVDPIRQAPPAGSGLAPASSELIDVKSLQTAGFKVVPYTVNDPTRMLALIKLGVDGLISDRPDLVRQVLADYDANGDGTKGDYLNADGSVNPAKFDLQGHRGARNLRPENTLPAFEAGLDNLVTTLETDAGITSDGVPVLSHDPYVTSRKCRRSDGQPYTANDEVLIKDLTLSDLQSKYVCDGLIRGAPQDNNRALSPVAVAYAQQAHLPDPYAKPTLKQLFDFTAFYADYYKNGPGKSDPKAAVRAQNAERVHYNVETKLNPRSDKDDHGIRFDQRTIGPVPYAQKVAGVIESSGVAGRADVQSFDWRTLRVVHREHPDLPTVALLGDYPKFADPSLDGSDDGTNLQPQAGEQNTRWLAGLSWPYRQTAQSTPFRAQTSGGFEGMAIAPDGRTLLPLLEKPLKGVTGKLQISAFDTKTGGYTGDRWYYPLDPRGVSIGDFQLADRRHGLVIERDNSQGDLSGYKALEEIDLGAPGTTVAKARAADLMQIRDRDGISLPSRPGDVGLGDPFAFPFQTIEDLVLLGDRRVAVLNDNNFPFSSGRHKGNGRPDDNELIVLRLPRPIAER